MKSIFYTCYFHFYFSSIYIYICYMYISIHLSDMEGSTNYIVTIWASARCKFWRPMRGNVVPPQTTRDKTRKLTHCVLLFPFSLVESFIVFSLVVLTFFQTFPATLFCYSLLLLSSATLFFFVEFELSPSALSV